MGRLIFIFIAIVGLVSTPMASKGEESVILIHGLARSSNSMKKMAKHLEANGYDVHNIKYPSTKYSIQVLAEDLAEELAPVFESAQKVHFVTHSMGGILVRQILSTHSYGNLGRVVMLSPPNQGSEVVDRMKGWKAFKMVNGPAGLQLSTSDDSVPNRLGPVDFDLGVITGDRSINWILSRMIPGKDDGKVSVERAKVEGMLAFKVVHATHPMIMKNKHVIEYALQFLKTGVFEVKNTPVPVE